MPPSPLTHSTVASGAARLAPIEAGKAQPSEPAARR